MQIWLMLLSQQQKPANSNNKNSGEVSGKEKNFDSKAVQG